jgi:hypothetical protein
MPTLESLPTVREYRGPGAGRGGWRNRAGGCLREPRCLILACHGNLFNLTSRAFGLLASRIPSEESSGDRRRLGHISKQGNSLLRFLLVEAAQVTVRSLPEWRRKYLHLLLRRGRKIAKVAMARRLAVHLSWMMRKEWDS